MAVEPEELLVKAAQNSCMDSFATLYDRYYTPMVALAQCVLADLHLAEDAAQQAFAIACRDLPKLKREDMFAAWMAGICRNLARQMRRTKSKLSALNEQAQPKNGEEDYRDAVRRVVWRLRAVDREPIVLRYYDNMPYEQIASVLGISQQAVHGRLVRAKRKIADQLKSKGFTGGNYGKPG